MEQEPSSLSGQVQIDSELFEEVINNLIDNAVKYCFEASDLKRTG